MVSKQKVVDNIEWSSRARQLFLRYCLYYWWIKEETQKDSAGLEHRRLKWNRWYEMLRRASFLCVTMAMQNYCNRQKVNIMKMWSQTNFYSISGYNCVLGRRMIVKRFQRSVYFQDVHQVVWRSSMTDNGQKRGLMFLIYLYFWHHENVSWYLNLWT